MTTVTIVVDGPSGVGRGECNPWSVPGWSKARVLDEIRAVTPLIERGLSREGLLEVMRPGPARNAVDSALVDLECGERRISAGELFGIGDVRDVSTAMTVSLPGCGENFDFTAYLGLPIVKMKIDTSSDPRTVFELRRAVPAARIIVDANGSLDVAGLDRWIPALREAEVEVLEQPVARGFDNCLRDIDSGDVLLCADESFRSLSDLVEVTELYDMVNIKLDKSGGPTAAFQAAELARQAGLRIMVGCMMGTSLSTAPAWWLAQTAEVADIDGPTLLAADIEHPMKWSSGLVSRPSPDLWG